MEEKIGRKKTGKEPLDQEELQAQLVSQIEDAKTFVEGVIGASRTLATQYYHGEPFGDEKTGRSQVISRDVRDAVTKLLPDLLRMFFGSENVVEFLPRTEKDVPAAEQATDYTNYVVRSDNDGFLVFHDAFKDALIRKMGLIKYWYEDIPKVERTEHTGLSEEGALFLMGELEDDNAEIEEDQDPKTGLWSLNITRTTQEGRIRIAAVPPEDFLISRRARNLETAPYYGHRSMVTVSDLVQMGYDYEEVIDHVSSGDGYREGNREILARQPDFSTQSSMDNDPATQQVLYIENYFRIDADGDGIAELRKICTIGEDYFIVNDEVADSGGFAVFCPEPEPHSFFGYSVADSVMDVQRIKSVILRLSLDSLAQALHNKTVVVEDMVNMDDVLSTDPAAVIRAKAPNMVQPMVTPFLGEQAMPMLEMYDQIKEDRTGISRASAGLDPGALQSASDKAIMATTGARERHVELIARVFAETGMRQLYRGILKLLAQHQDQERVVRLRDTWVPIDPRSWDADMDVQVNVTVGAASKEEKIASYIQILGKQEGIIQQLGPTNPLVSLSLYRNALAKIMELSGVKDSARYFKPVSPEQEQQFEQQQAQQAQQQPQQQDPAAILAQVQGEEIRANIAIKQAEMQLKQEESLRKDDLERDRLDQDLFIAVKKIEAEHTTKIDTAEIQARKAAARPKGNE